MIDIAKASVSTSEEVLLSYERQFEVGRKSWMDITNAVRDLSQNQINYTRIMASTYANYYRLILLTRGSNR
ncbi:hypothetical protein CAK78_10255 [Aeromonas sp. A35_P]|nr:hypothetical protein CAK78_10255 [Aeromonas sp. A35_P]